MPAKNTKCLVCKKAPPEHIAVLPYALKNGDMVEPADYGVCNGCHREQYKQRYGFTPEEAPSRAPKSDPFEAEYA